MLGETAQLMVELNLGGNFTGGMQTASRELGAFSGNVGGATGKAVGAFGALRGAAMGVGSALGHAGSQLKGLITGPFGMLGLAGGAAGIGLALKNATDSATNFQSAMELIATQAGGTQQEVESMTAAILKLAPSVATGPEQLAAGLYHVESAGIRGAKALDVLTAAAQGAKVGNADLESVTNALIASVNSGIKGTTDMSQAMGVLNSVVGAGNMRMQDLADAFSTGILSTARTFGISIQSVGAAIADMTNQGVPAIDAATRLRMSINLLGAPTSKAAAEFKSIGLGQLDLANAMRGPGGILSAIQLLAQHMTKAGLIDANGQVTAPGADLLSKAFGGGRSSSAIMTLVGSIGKLGEIQQQVISGAGSFGDAWTRTTQDAQFKFQRLQASMSTLAINLGNAILPTLTEIADAAGTWIGDPANQQSLVGALKSAIDMAKAVGGAISTFVIPVFRKIADAWGMLPEGLRNLLVGGFVANKAAGWLFGSQNSPVSLIQRMFSGLTSKIPVVGGALAGGTPVFVTNWPGGFGPGGGGGLPNILPTAAGGGALATLGTVFAGTLAALFETKGGLDALGAINEASKTGDVRGAIQAGTSLTSPGSMIARGIFGTSDPLGDWLHSTFGISIGYRPQDQPGYGMGPVSVATGGSERGTSQLLPAINKTNAILNNIHGAQEVAPVETATKLAAQIQRDAGQKAALQQSFAGKMGDTIGRSVDSMHSGLVSKLQSQLAATNRQDSLLGKIANKSSTLKVTIPVTFYNAVTVSGQRAGSTVRSSVLASSGKMSGLLG